MSSCAPYPRRPVRDEAVLRALDVHPAVRLALLAPGRRGLGRGEPQRTHGRRREGETLEAAVHGAASGLSDNGIISSLIIS